MTKHSTNKKNRQTYLAGAAFCCTLVVVCLLLFLFSDSGEAMLARLGLTQTVYEPTPAVSPGTNASGTSAPETKKRLSSDAFMERAASFGANGETTLSSENDRIVVYALQAQQVEFAELTLSLQSGGVTAFTLAIQWQSAPKPLAPDADALLTRAHDDQQESYEAGIRWCEDAFQTYALALDDGETLAYAEIRLLAEEVRRVMEEGGSLDTKSGGYVLNASRETEGAFTVTFRAES